MLPGNYLNPVLFQQSRCYPIACFQRAGECPIINRATATRWTPRFQDNLRRAVRLGNAQGIERASQVCVCHVLPCLCYDFCFVGEHILAIAADNFGWRPRCGQTAELFRAD